MTMKHHRSPTRSYTQNLSTHASLALRHSSIPTLLSPLRSSVNTPPHDDALDDFQSNAWLNAPPCRPPLAGLGINCLPNQSAIIQGQLLPSDSALRMQVDGDETVLSFHSHGLDIPSDDFHVPTVPLRDSESKDNHRVAYSLGEERTAYLDLLDDDTNIDPTANDIVGLIPDLNMYDKLRTLELQYPGVNPLDTIYNTSFHDARVPYGEAASLTPKDNLSDDVLPAMDSRIEQSPSPRVIQDIMSILVRPAPLSSANSPSAQSFSPLQFAAQKSSRSITLEPTNVPDSEDCTLPASCNLGYPTSTHPSPILNAHLGIELSELVSRAERFKSKYPERDIERAWLSHFAGKLSDRGELLNDFRCYIIGCDQRNKRRDHILVHVGAHIGQRPFACSLCPLRFLRKNECKRHEASHSGFRPYSCDICGQSFVRQDLVKRHVKKTHGVRDENDSGVGKQPRKRAKLLQ